MNNKDKIYFLSFGSRDSCYSFQKSVDRFCLPILSNPIISFTENKNIPKKLDAKFFMAASPRAFISEKINKMIQKNACFFIAGEKTAEAAYKAGFDSIKIISRTGAELVEKINKELELDSISHENKIVFLRGEKTSINPEIDIPTAKIEEIIVYRSNFAKNIPSKTLEILNNGRFIAIFFSELSVDFFISEIVKNKYNYNLLKKNVAVCISKKVSKKISNLPWGEILPVDNPEMFSIVNIVLDKTIANLLKES